jgi:hypothetical protein
MATTEEQYELVYQGICAVAAHCDGATTQDGVGFNGQDTHFGRRIASVPFDQWTDDVKAEAARIANTYQVQILTYTGIDVTALQVVQDAKDVGTNHLARDDARAYERRAKGADKLALRKIDAVGDKLGIFYDRKDPDFGALLDVCKALPGRTFDWDRKCNVVPVSPAIEDFILEWDFPLTDAAKALLAAGPVETFALTLADNGQKLVIDTPYNPTLVERIRTLPGRSWDGARKVNTVDIHPDVLVMAVEYGLSVSPEARAALNRSEETLAAAHADALVEEDRRTVMAHISRQKDPEALPEVFVDMLAAILPADVAEKVIV